PDRSVTSTGSNSSRSGGRSTATRSRTGRPPSRSASATRPERDPFHHLVPGAPSWPLAEERVDEHDLVDGPGAAAERVQDAQPCRGVVAPAHPREREMRPEPRAVRSTPGGVGGRAGPGGERIARPLPGPGHAVRLHAGPPPPGPPHRRDRAGPGQPEPERFVLAADRGEAVDQLVDAPLVDARAERQGEVPLRRGGPRRARPRLEEAFELRTHVLRRQD